MVQQFVDDGKLAKAVFVAGCLHDLGKIDPEFQQWVYQVIKKTKGEAVPEEGQHIDKGKFSFETHPRHNEISLLLYHLMSDDADKTTNKRNKDRIKHVLYWHHAKPIRKTEFKKLDSVYKKLKKNIGSAVFSTLIQTIGQITKAIDSISEEYFPQVPIKVTTVLQKKVDEDKEYELAETSLPSYKRYSLANDDVDDYLADIKDNAKNNLARTAVITADRLISSLNSEQLDRHIKEKTLDSLIEEQVSLKDSNLTEKIQQCLLGFEKCLRWYTLRWRIEDWHRVLKSGCKIDELAHETAERLCRAIGINLVIAWRIMLMTLLGRQIPELPAEILFSDVELRTLHAYAKKKN